IVQGLDHDFNLRRLERYLVMIHQSGAAPVIVLTKSDTTPHGQTMKEKAEAAAPGTPVFLVNALSGEGLAPLTELLGPGKTGVLVGSSGAGKSTLINALLGNGSQKTQAVRAADSRGRHTTTARQMFFLPNGGSIIDNPGMRELALWTTTSSVDEVFPDIETYAGHCRFRDCAHEMEPGCAVRRAVEQGDLSEERLASYHKLLRESQHLDLREDPLGALREKGKEKALHRAIRSVTKTKRHYRDGFE
ncbi:MAG: ribosome small subunit-dependent GTPase A, partial [Spirochaetia bacterium]|nr:ribosome small subunit-dependent GTPase A [Spirochaetia bacterium]